MHWHPCHASTPHRHTRHFAAHAHNKNVAREYPTLPCHSAAFAFKRYSVEKAQESTWYSSHHPALYLNSYLEAFALQDPADLTAASLAWKQQPERTSQRAIKGERGTGGNEGDCEHWDGSWLSEESVIGEIMPMHRERASAFKASLKRLFAEVISQYPSWQGRNGYSTQILLLGAWKERSFMTTDPRPC